MALEKTMIIGVSGSGKTNFALTACQLTEKPCLVLDLDCKAQNALPSNLLPNIEIEPLPSPPLLTGLSIRASDFDMKGKEGKGVPKEEAPEAYRNFIARVNHVYREQPEKYGVVIVDCWSQLCLGAASELHQVKKSIGQILTIPDYGILNSKYMQLIPFIVGIPCDHVILTAHEDISKDEDTHTLFFSPWTVGQAIRPVMPGFFDNVYRTRTVTTEEGTAYRCRTRAYQMFLHGKTKHSSLPLDCPSSFPKMAELEKGGP